MLSNILSDTTLETEAIVAGIDYKIGSDVVQKDDSKSGIFRVLDIQEDKIVSGRRLIALVRLLSGNKDFKFPVTELRLATAGDKSFRLSSQSKLLIAASVAVALIGITVLIIKH